MLLFKIIKQVIFLFIDAMLTLLVNHVDLRIHSLLVNCLCCNNFWYKQLIVHRCEECGQPLPESYQPPADEDWTTGICGCLEDTQTCKYFKNTF